MPESQMYRRSVPRDALVEKYGETTMARAEVAVILNLLVITGFVKPSEFVDAVVSQCERIDDERRAQANLDADRG
jgi:hypothetical protein